MTREQELYAQRQKKRAALETRGLALYPAHSNQTHTIGEVVVDPEKVGSAEITLAGRLRALRGHGKSTFADLQDQTGTIQLFLSFDHLKEQYQDLKQYDLGDFIEASGTLFTTQRGQLSLEVHHFAMLSKSLRPLPEKFHGLKDHELRMRNRHLDLLTNPAVLDIFKKQALFLKHFRSFLDRRGYLEVVTPVLQPIPGGTLATPFKTHHDALDIDLYMRIAPELYLKRLVVGGIEKVYEIGTIFRNEGISPQHLQEFVEIEIYTAYMDYRAEMLFTEQLITECLQKTFGTLRFTYQGQALDFTAPWPRRKFAEIIKEDTGIDILEISDKKALIAAIKARNLSVEVEKDASYAKIVDELYKTYSRPKIIQPTLVIDPIVELSPLAKRPSPTSRTVERYQLVVSGFELINGYSELNDPVEQAARFRDQQKAHNAGDAEAHLMDQDYVDALEYGMPPTAGLGLGFARLMAIVMDQPNVREVVLFPLLRPHEDQSSKTKKKK